MSALSWALAAAARGTDVYLFLIGMMALAGYAHVTGVFDWVAARAVRIAGGSRWRLFALVYGAGILTTALLSNDATIVVLTPAVIDALRRVDASPLPYVVACALIANAASFLLPISNPSNLLVFAGRMPALGTWLALFGLPSLAAIVVTFANLWWFYRRELAGTATAASAREIAKPPALAVGALLAAAALIVATSARSGPIGAVTFACGLATLLVTLVRDRAGAGTIVREISWRVVALTALLFVVISRLDESGGYAVTRALFTWCAQQPAPWSLLAAGFASAAASNLTNNLPIGLNLGETLPALHAAPALNAAALLGVNLGPNATINGSLATLLWLSILKRAGIPMTWLGFARIGVLTTIPALTAALLLLRG